MLTPGRIVWYRPLAKDMIAEEHVMPLVAIVLGLCDATSDPVTYRLAVFDRLAKTHSRIDVRHVEGMDGSMLMTTDGYEGRHWFSLPQKALLPQDERDSLNAIPQVFPTVGCLNTEPPPDGTGFPMDLLV